MAKLELVPTVIVEVKGGVVQAVYADPLVAKLALVRVMDWDNAAEDDDYKRECKEIQKLIEVERYEQVF